MSLGDKIYFLVDNDYFTEEEIYLVLDSEDYSDDTLDEMIYNR